MRLTIARHAQTIANRKGICQYQVSGCLSKEGKSQAKCLGRVLKNEKFDIIFSSDSERALDTAKEIIKYHKVPLVKDRLLREKNLGVFIGKTRAEYYAAMEKSGLPRMLFRPKNGESYSDIEKRARKFIKKLLKRKEKDILIITHGGMVRMFAGILLGLPAKQFLEMPPHNAGLSIFESHSKNFKAIKLNSSYHLRKK